MRILHILNTHADEGNGIVNVALDNACLQAKLGHDVVIVSRSGDFADVLARYGVRHIPLDQRRTPANILRALRRFREFTAQFDPDVVHAHMVTGLVIALLTRRGRRYRVVATVHNQWQRTAALMRFADRIIGVSEAVVESVRRQGVSKAKLFAVLNGPLGSPRNEVRVDVIPTLARPAIVTVAGLFERKGIDDLLAAFEIVSRSLPQAELYLVGDGPDRRRYQAMVGTMPNRSKIHFEGFQLNPHGYMKACDLFVLASRREPGALALSEARAAGCAIVATDVDGIPELLDRGRCGLLVPSRDPARLAQAIISMLQDDARRAAFRLQAVVDLERLSAERNARETLAVYTA